MSINPVSTANISQYRNYSAPTNMVESVGEPLHSFARQDEAIVSSQAKILNELEKYNSGQSDEVSLALTTVTSKLHIEANLRVIQAKDEILEDIIGLVGEK